MNPLIFEFLKALKDNNNREWFHENKSFYQEARNQFELFTSMLIHEIGFFDKDINSLEAKDCIFRIYRDVRFTKNKEPYKTNFGAFISSGGKKLNYAGYYIHIEPGESFLAGGIYHPPGDILKIIRNEIFENTDEFKGIIHDPAFSKHFSKIEGEKLKNPPRDFPVDYQDMDLIKFKSYNVIKYYPDEVILKPSFLEECKSVFTVINPFNQFFNYRLKEHYNPL